MHSSVWRTDGRQATIDSPHFSARLDVWRPSNGLTDVRALGHNIPGASFLGIEQSVDEYAPQEVECYTRGRDLVATYAQRPEFPFRMQVYWRATDPSDLMSGIELVAAIQTNLLDTWPEVAARSRVAVTHLRALACDDANRYETIALDATQSRTLGSDAYRGCFVGQLADGPLSYAEMVHPADFHASQVRRESSGGLDDRTMALEHDLFKHHLEKGVILKARLRTMFFLADSDRDIAETYEDFANSEPPLTT